MGDDGRKLSAWLGIAASFIGVLAFLGITNIKQLSHALSPHPTATTSRYSYAAAVPRWTITAPVTTTTTTSATATACKLAGQALTTMNDTADPNNNASYAESQRIFAEQLQQAAYTTTDVVLQTDLRNDAYDEQQYADALDARDTSIEIQLTRQENVDLRTWITYCGQSH